MYTLSRDARTFALFREQKLQRFREFFMPQTIIHDCSTWSPPFKARPPGEEVLDGDRVIRLVVTYHPLLKKLQNIVDQRLGLWNEVLQQIMHRKVRIQVVYRGGGKLLSTIARKLHI